MQSKDFIYYEDKNKKICSLGIEIDNILMNNEKKGIFRKNLGIPLSLFLLNNEQKKMMNIINNIDPINPISNIKKFTNANEKNIMETSCIGDDIFEKLIDLRKNSSKKQKKSRRRRKKHKKKTRKLSIF